MTAPVTPGRPLALLRFLDVVVLVVAAPIMLLIGVSPAGYLVGAGVWILLRAVGVAVEHAASASANPSQAIGLRLGFLLGRLFMLAIAVILVRKSGGRDAGLAALLVIVFAYTMAMFLSIVERPRR